jgi:hypothetical protein
MKIEPLCTYCNNHRAQLNSKSCKNCKQQRISNRLLKIYGITFQEYSEKLSKQGGMCAICHERRGQPNLNKRLMPVDHNHKTGKTRDILCPNCNVALGLMDENQKYLNNMINYIEKHNNIKLTNKIQTRKLLMPKINQYSDI